MHKGFIKTAALLGALSVILGAFAAHGLKQYVQADSISTFDTGVRYQFYHTLALLAVGMLFEKFPNKWLRYAGNCFIIGIILFSGSLYAVIACKAIDVTGVAWINIITPFGGLFFITGWLLFWYAIFASPKSA